MKERSAGTFFHWRDIIRSMAHVDSSAADADVVADAIRSAALVFYREGEWSPFPDDSPESRLTKPDEQTHVQFNHIPGRRPHAEYRGPRGRWWVAIDAATGMPSDTPIFVPSVDASSSSVN
jgi:hypothetical protein